MAVASPGKVNASNNWYVSIYSRVGGSVAWQSVNLTVPTASALSTPSAPPSIAVALSGDGSCLVVGFTGWNGGVQSFTASGNTWTSEQVLSGDDGGLVGASVSMSFDGMVVAYGAPAGLVAGYVAVFSKTNKMCV